MQNIEPCECLKRHEHQPPLALIHVDGGIAEGWYVVEGTGKPEVHILDFDRGDEPPDDLDEFVEIARETLTTFKARGIDTSDLDADIDEIEERAADLRAHA